MSMTEHNRGVELARKWLAETYGCNPIYTEVKLMSGEQPDVIGFLKNGKSVVVDWKESLSDFKAHLKKPHVQRPQDGAGNARWIACNPQVIKEDVIVHSDNTFGL